MNYTLSENDVAVLRRLIAREKERIPYRRPTVEVLDVQSPDVFAALTPDTGIPGLLPDVGTGSGTGTDVGRGNVPGVAMCQVFRVLDNYGSPDMYDVGLERPVYNLSQAEVSPETWVLAVRDKFGSFFAVPTAVGGGGGTGPCFRFLYDVGVTVSCVSGVLTTTVTKTFKWFNPVTGLTQDTPC